MPEPVPVHVLTGFLGSGKTTLLNRWLADPALGDTAVVVNEFGEVGIDHALVAAAEEDLLLLQSGCVCCSIRGDLVDALADLAGRRDAGEIPPFRRVVLETTGLADPGPILQTLMTDPALVGRYRPGTVTATADALHGAAQLDEHPEAVRQAAFAERIVLTKLDIAEPGARAAIAGRLAAVNALARIVDAAEAGPDALLAEAADAPPDLPAAAGAHDHDHAHRHGEDIRAFCYVDPRPVRWPAFVAWLDALTSLRGADVLRIKGIVNVEGRESPVVVNGVHHVLHPPAALAAWPEGRRETRLAVITRGIDGLDLARALEAAHAHNPDQSS